MQFEEQIEIYNTSTYTVKYLLPHASWGKGWLGILFLARSIAKKREFRSQVTEPRECIHTKATQTYNTNCIYYNKTNFKTCFYALTCIGWFVVQAVKLEELNKKSVW
jgi:hypothetical protein